MRVALLHPGAMGSAVGACLREAGHDVRWCAAGRSAATAQRAVADGLHEVANLAAVLDGADLAVSIVPPHAAGDVAEAVAGADCPPTYLDANAIAPATAAEIRARIEAAGARYVDGSLIGPPPREAGSTRLYLSGEGAAGLASFFAGGLLEAVVLEGDPLAASALKMAFAGWTKGSAALLLAVRELARRDGLEAALLAEWRRSMPELVDRSDAIEARIGQKAWRYVGEMLEIARAMGARDLPEGFHAAAAEVFRAHPRPPA